MQITLRNDQAQLKFDIVSGWNSGERNQLAVLPTGGGKSIITSDIVNDGNILGMQQVVIAHRQELVGQMSLHVARRGIHHRIIGPKNVVAQITASHRREFEGRSFISPSAICSVAGVDTLVARATDLVAWAQQIDRWVIDEAHHVLRENKWGRAVTMFPRAFGLGVTATPQRADGMGLGSHADGVFDAMQLGPDMRQLINLGALCDYEIVIPPSDFHVEDDDFSKDGELSPKKGRMASQRSHIVGDVVKEYTKYAYGKRGITFATDVETANEIAQKFNEAGIPAASVSAKTPSEVRDEYIRRFRVGQLWMLVNVDLFGEGFDVPAVEVVIMARPTASLAVYLQQFGRALRTLFGKTHGLIIDHVSNYKRHGFPDKFHDWSLDRREKRSKSKPDPELIELTRCSTCAHPYEKVLPVCPHCQTVPELTPAGRKSIETVDGDLILLDRDELARRRAMIELEEPASLKQRVAQGAGFAGAGDRAMGLHIEKIAAQTRLKDAIAQWAGIERAKGRHDQETYRRFYLTMGVDVLGALAADRTRQDYEKTAEIVEGWYA